MSLQKDPIIMDDWSDVKERSKQNAEKAAAEADNKDVTKKFVNEQISASEEKDNAEEQEEYQKIYQKIADISAGGGTDLSPYLKKVEAEETYAKKSDIPEPVDLSDYAKKSEIPSVEGLVDEAELTAAVADKATIAQVAAVDQKVDAIVIPDTSAFATKSELVAATENLVDVETFNNSLADKATMAQVAAVDQKVDAIVIPDTSAFVTEEDLADYAKKSDIPEPVDLTDYAKKSDIPDVSNFITEEDLMDYAKKSDIPEIPSLDEYAKKSDIPDVSNFATKDEIPSVDGFATTEYVNQEIARVEEEIPDISALATKDELAEVEGKIPSVDGLVTAEQLTEAVSDKATIAQVAAVDQKVDAIVIPDTSAFITEEALVDYAKKSDIPDVSNFATKDEIPSVAGLASEQYVDTKIADLVDGAPEELNSFKELSDALKDQDDAVAAINATLATKATKNDISTFVDEVQMTDALSLKANTTDVNALEAKLWNKSTDCFYTKKTVNSVTSTLFNENDGGGSMIDTSELKSFVGVNDGGDPSTGIHVQIYSKTKADNKGARLNVNPSGIFYGVGTSAVISPETELAVKGDIFDVSAALSEKANTIDVSTAFETVETTIDTKADADAVPTKTEFEVLKANYEALKQLVYEYLPDAEQEAIHDGEIADLSPDNKSVHVNEPMKSVVLPESTGTLYTVEVPLRDESSIELTSPKTATISNTSDSPVSTTISAPESTGTNNTKLYLSGQFENLELTNISIDKSSSYDAAIISGTVTVTETNTKPVTVAAEFANGAVVKNDSECEITLNNKSAAGSSVTVLAPGSTVTIQSGQWAELDSTVSDNTLYISNKAHIDKLIVTKGNVVVNSFAVENCVDLVINKTEYTVTPKIIEVTTKNDWNKASSTDALYEVQNDIETNIRIAPGIFGSQAKMKLNGHTVTCTDANGAFLLRGDSHYIIENGTINATGYGIWLAGPGTVELHSVEIIANSHALYIEKTGGNIYTTGNCRFSVSNDDKRYVANYLDATYTGGWTHGFHFGIGTQFIDFNPAASMGEPNGPVNLLDDGLTVEHSTEVIDGVEHDVYTVVALVPGD